MTIYVAMAGDSIGDKFILVHIKFNSNDGFLYQIDLIVNFIF